MVFPDKSSMNFEAGQVEGLIKSSFIQFQNTT